MNEDELSDFLFDSLAGSGIDLFSGIPVTPIRLFMRLFNWIEADNPVHKRAASNAVRKYIDYNNPPAFFDYNRF